MALVLPKAVTWHFDVYFAILHLASSFLYLALVSEQA